MALLAKERQNPALSIISTPLQPSSKGATGRREKLLLVLTDGLARWIMTFLPCWPSLLPPLSSFLSLLLPHASSTTTNWMMGQMRIMDGGDATRATAGFPFSDFAPPFGFPVGTTRWRRQDLFECHSPKRLHFLFLASSEEHNHLPPEIPLFQYFQYIYVFFH